MEATSDVDTTKILEKGPEYLRKQMELESEAKGGTSAVERLAASKPKYVKSQQVVNTTQEPVINFGSPSVSSNGSSNRSSNHHGKLLTGRNSPAGAQVCSPQQDNVVRRSSSKKRPDSLLLYRQKCELLRGSTSEKHKQHVARRMLLSSVYKDVPLPEATDKEGMSDGDDTKSNTLVRSTKQGSSNAVNSHSEKMLTRTTCQNEAIDQVSEENNGPRTKVGIVNKPGHKRVTEVQRRGCNGVSRSHSDISSRYSKNFADFDAFFKYCGLDGEVIESLGKKNFSARSDELAINIRSVSVSTSDDGFSRNSGESDGLLEEELNEKIRQGTSVIERNARIIKWLYSCQNAKESGKKLRELD
ncbi:protein FAM110C [Lampris incognitus]|uniref:protein FAM110C n=1 Tax=Lampris incognitus TaxID=2546036 RepID=UPI0024B49291|nr:protein FAM110C [Lampris incognitus]